MPKIPDTFCPAKWDELIVSLELNYASACCKGAVGTTDGNVMQFISKEKLNLLNGVRDESCNYCWRVEEAGAKSLRHTYLETFDPNTFDDYKEDRVEPGFVEVNIGNECNFQCTYCNPKFSSVWEHDVKTAPMKLAIDKHFFGVAARRPDVMDLNIEHLKQFSKLTRLSITGGEPLLNKKFFQLIQEVNSTELSVVTNLSCKQSTIDRFIAECSRYNAVYLRVSIDATKQIAEFTRYGLNFEQFTANLNYLIANRPPNLTIYIGSVMSSVTVRDLDAFSKYVTPMLSDHVKWHIEYIHSPITQSMKTLPDHYRAAILETINGLTQFDIKGLDALKSVVATTTFNKLMHQELKHFMNEFSKRKNIPVPICLD